MRPLKTALQWIIITGSLGILALVLAAALWPAYRALLPVAGLLASVNGILHSRAIEGLFPSVRRWLVGSALVNAAAMIALLWWK